MTFRDTTNTLRATPNSKVYTTASQHGTLAAGVITTVIVPFGAASLEVMNRSGSAEIYFTLDDSDPTVRGNNTFVLPASIGSVDQDLNNASGEIIVKMISSGTPTYSVLANLYT